MSLTSAPAMFSRRTSEWRVSGHGNGRALWSVDAGGHSLGGHGRCRRTGTDGVTGGCGAGQDRASGLLAGARARGIRACDRRACLRTEECPGRHGRAMSKARLVITAVVTEGRSQGEVARAYGVSQGWVSRLVARYRAEGEGAFEPRSRRPKTSPGATGSDTVELIVTLRKELAGQGLDAGPHTICWHLQHHHGIVVSAATVSRHLTRAGLVTPDPAKRPRSSICGLRRNSRTNAGSPTSPTTGWPAAPIPRSCAGSMTTPGTCCT